MQLSKKKMQQIVEELRGVINRDINIMDKSGTIIASTDEARIGMHHAGAQRIIDRNMNKLLIGEDDAYKGSKSGINLPLYNNEEIVGVVGITGEQKEVEHFGKVIKKMTEILITDEFQKDQNQIIETAKNNFIYTWLFESIQEDEENFERKGRLLGIDVHLNRTVIVLVIESINETNESNDVERQSLSNRVVKRIRKMLDEDKQNIVVQIGARIIVLLHEDSTSNAYLRINNIKEVIEPRYNINLGGGIGSVASKVFEIRHSFKEAEMTCEFISNLNHMDIRVYGDVDIEMLLQTIPYQQRISFLNKIFNNCSKKEIDSYSLLLRTLIENNGSISQTATSLYLHKNTIQYRLTKLKALTGYDPRIMKEMVPLYVALLIYEDSKTYIHSSL